MMKNLTNVYGIINGSFLKVASPTPIET